MSTNPSKQKSATGNRKPQMNNQPLTPEQIWGVPAEQLPEPEIKDYFKYEIEERQTQHEKDKMEGPLA